MRLSALVFLVPVCLLAQGKEPPKSQRLAIPVLVASPQQAQVFDVPVCGGMSSVLESFRMAVKNSDGKPLHASHQALVDAWISDVGVIGQLIVGISISAPIQTACTATETLRFSLNADAVTSLETKRLNLLGRATASPDGARTLTPMFATKTDVFRSAVKTRGGIFWNLVLRFPPDSLQLLLASNPPTSDVVAAAVAAIVQ